MAILFSLRVLARNLLRGNRRKNAFCILFWHMACRSNPGYTSNKPTHYLLGHDDFNMRDYVQENFCLFTIHIVCKSIYIFIIKYKKKKQKYWATLPRNAEKALISKSIRTHMYVNRYTYVMLHALHLLEQVQCVCVCVCKLWWLVLL